MAESLVPTDEPSTDFATRASRAQRRRATTSAPALRGDLAHQPLLDLVQALADARRDGELVLERDHPHQAARIALREGRVVDAYCPPLVGEACFFALATWTTGRFLFLAGARAERQTIDCDTRPLLIEAARRADELAELRRALPPGRIVLHRERDGERTRDARLFLHEWRMLELIDGRRTVDHLIDARATDAVDAARALMALIENGVVTTSERIDFLADIVCRRMRDARPVGCALAERLWDACDGVATLAALQLELGCHGHDLVETTRTSLDAQHLVVVAGFDAAARWLG